MAKRSNTRRTNSTPGVYYKETELQYATKSLGITTLGIAGETVKGPAFQPIQISDWREYQSYFGGKNPEKFLGSKYPKYELPYIANEYLKESKKLEVVRTLGFSGANAGPAWVITATKYNCKEGYVYEKNDDMETDIPTDKDDFYNKTSPEKNKFFIPTVPECETEKDEYGQEIIDPDTNKPIPAYGDSIKVVNAHQSMLHPVYFDENDNAKNEAIFNSLPQSIKDSYQDVYTLITDIKDANGDIQPFLYLDLSKFKNNCNDDRLIGYCAITFDGDVVDVRKLDNERGLNFTETCSQSDSKLFVIITKEWFYNNINPSSYNPDYDFNQSKIKLYNYNYGYMDDNYNFYPNQDENYKQMFDEDGTTNVYNMSEEKQTICNEDEDAEFANVAICVLRSRGQHVKYVAVEETECGPVYDYDGMEYYAKKVSLKPYSDINMTGCENNYSFFAKSGDFGVDETNYGKFNIAIDYVKGCSTCGIQDTMTVEYSVSLNPNDDNYITKILGVGPFDNNKPVYVEDLYDVALEQLIYAGEINAINNELAYYPEVYINPEFAPVKDFATDKVLKKSDVGDRYVYTLNESYFNNGNGHVQVYVNYGNTGTQTQKSGWVKEDGKVGHIYTVMSRQLSNGTKEYFYGETYGSEEVLTPYDYISDVENNKQILRNCVFVEADKMYYILKDTTSEDGDMIVDLYPITLDFNNYKEPYRYASTPWIVSQIGGSGDTLSLKKLFRFHTISDGDNSCMEIKISIENIDVENGVFDVVIRDFNDSDLNPSVIERFGKCCLIPGESNYLGLKIGTHDEVYSVKSAYVTVEINEDDDIEGSIPCGFLGYPIRNYRTGLGIMEKYNGLTTKIKQPYIKYNTTIDDDLNIKKQYFGMSDLTGIDNDMLTYKGVEAYNDDPFGLTPCFHLDSRIFNGTPGDAQTANGEYYIEQDNIKQVVSVDGITGYSWSTVSKSILPSETCGLQPKIGGNGVVIDTIYENKSYAKFTVCFYGGWDGWDYYRTSRSNSDEFRQNKYKGKINKTTSIGNVFSYIKDPTLYGFSSDEKAITSDYYAYLAAFKQLDNPKTVAINVFATPGIDYVNQKLLVDDVIDIIENDRGDSLYVVTTPDKPFGAGDTVSEMYTAQEAVNNLEDSEIDTNYACTYYPWIKYWDSDNNKYIYLPPTTDVVRDIAYTDNVAYSWYASAGWTRGSISGEGPKRKLKLKEQNILYDGRINFVNSFAQDGNKIWGDKNLQVSDGIMSRISKRRLLLRIKQQLSTACIGLIFDPNDTTMVDTFKSCVRGVLEPIMNNRGITDYRIEVDDSAEARDRLELPAKILIKPTQLLEFIDIELAVTPQGVSWD